jgi:hypothetical protein
MTDDPTGEITRHFRDYMATFDRDDVEGCLKFFAIPCTLISFGRVLYVDSREVFLNHWEATRVAMRRDTISQSRLGPIRVFPLDDNTAFTSLIIERVAPDGAVLNRTAGAYSLFKGPEGWKVVTFIMHRPEAWLGAQLPA